MQANNDGRPLIRKNKNIFGFCLFSVFILLRHTPLGFAQDLPQGITTQEKQGILYYRQKQYYHARDKFIEAIVADNQAELAKAYLDKIGRLKNTLTQTEQHRVMQFLSIIEHINFLRKQIRDVKIKNIDLMKFIVSSAGDDSQIRTALQSLEKSMNDILFTDAMVIELNKYYQARRYDLAEIIKVLADEKKELLEVLDEVGVINSRLRAVREEVLRRVPK